MDFAQKLYTFLQEFQKKYEYSPSFSQITQALNLSPNSKSLISRGLRTLEKLGKVTTIKEGRRLSIAITKKSIKLLGKIAAGSPIEALENEQDLNLENLLQGYNRFALQVIGDSMVDEGILNGDIIICRQTNTAKEGDIVVALIDNQNATLKKISFKMPGMITLIPANPELKPRAYPSERVHIQGIYIGLIRC